MSKKILLKDSKILLFVLLDLKEIMTYFDSNSKVVTNFVNEKELIDDIISRKVNNFFKKFFI